MSDSSFEISPWRRVQKRDFQRRVEVEDDTLRDGFQAISVTKPTSLQIDRLVELTDTIGIEHVVVGFPGASSEELEQSINILSTIKRLNLKFRPWVLTRFSTKDIVTYYKLRDQFPDIELGVALFKATSSIRNQIEGWSLNSFIDEGCSLLDELCHSQAIISLNLEDATRTAKHDLEKILLATSQFQIYSLALCDSVGELLPNEVEEFVKFVVSERNKLMAHTKLLWHGHNDQGVAHASSIAAIQAGADIVSGTFLGVGERAGNSPIEQLLTYLNVYHSQDYDLKSVISYCREFSQYAKLDISHWAPIIGRDAFSTQTGTHISAICKSISSHAHLHERVYNSLCPSDLGRNQSIRIGPYAGKSAIRHVTQSMGYSISDRDTEDLLSYVRQKNYVLHQSDILAWLKTNVHMGDTDESI